MAKSHKRRREANSSDENEADNSKKIKLSTINKATHKGSKHKEPTHDISSSESEDSTEIPTQSQPRKVDVDVNKPNRNAYNGHLLSSDSDNGRDPSYKYKKKQKERTTSENGEVSNNESEYSEKSEDNVYHIQKTKKGARNKSESSTRLQQIPKFTHQLHEDIAELSLLLNENLLEKNDIWLLQCPSDMDCSAVVGQRLSLGGSCQLDDGQNTYEAYSYGSTGRRSATLAVPSQRNNLKLCRMPIAGNIIVEKSVNVSKSSSQIIAEPQERVELPKDLRTRHPLLGTDFRDQPRTVIMNREKVFKKKKHSKKHKQSMNGELDPENDTIKESLKDNTSKRKKKRKHRDNDSFCPA